MADGNQGGFNFPHRLPASKLRPGEIVVDFFAGGGGASEALRQALGRDPDVAVNHDPEAIGMHAANHPFTKHMEADVWTVDILREVAGRPVGWFHASPDCTHHSQAKGGQPRDKAMRSLSWVVLKVAGRLARHGNAPRIISLENVKEILKWGPLIAKRCAHTGRVVTLDKVTCPDTGITTNRVADPGEHVPVRNQFLVPDKKHIGRTWGHFVAALRGMGYVVEWRRMVASDFGAGTSRERLFMVARRDGIAPQWPTPTHGPGREHPYVTAADCIDWTLDCPSIFTRKKPLADATLRRIAKGVRRYVLDAAEPFIIPLTHQGERRLHPNHEPLPTITAANRGELAAVQPIFAPLLTEHANGSNQRTFDVREPLRTQCAGVKGGHFSLVATTLVQTGYGERVGQSPRSLDLHVPLGTVVSGQKHALVSAFIEQANGGGENGNPARARGAHEPVSSITASGSQQRIVTAHMAKLRGTSSAASVDDSLATISAGGEHHALVTGHLTAFGQNAKGSDAREPMQTALGGATRFGVIECSLSPEQTEGALRVAAMLVSYYGTGQPIDVRDPLDTVTTRDRLALVTVVVRGTPYVIVDIGLRMLKPNELFKAQGFPADYVIDRTGDGKRLSIGASVRMVGNSVSPPPLAAIARANLQASSTAERIAA